MDISQDWLINMLSKLRKVLKLAKRMSISFTENHLEEYEYITSKDKPSNYLRNLIRKDMNKSPEVKASGGITEERVKELIEKYLGEAEVTQENKEEIKKKFNDGFGDDDEY